MHLETAMGQCVVYDIFFTTTTKNITGIFVQLLVKVMIQTIFTNSALWAELV